MPHGDLAQLSALVGAVGAALLLLARTRAQLLAGLAVTAAAEVGVGVGLIPLHDVRSLVASPARGAAVVVAAVLLCAAAALLVRYPALVPVALLAAAPFRIDTRVGSEFAYLLLPLYGVLAASLLALVVRALRGDPGPPLPPVLAVPAAAWVALSALSLTWSRDLRQGSIELLFFLFPFAALTVVAARSPWRAWHPRALAATLVALAAVFSAAALYQVASHGSLFARDVVVANAYNTYFRVTSLFKDPSVFGRHVVIAIAVLLVALWLGKLRAAPAAALVAFLFAGLFFAYSQSSYVSLFAVTAAVPLALGGRRLRRAVAVGVIAVLLAGVGLVAAGAASDSARKATSGRTRLARVTWVVFENHPLVGVGIGGQPAASKEEAKTQLSAKRDRSHTTPLTVAAELGVVGFLIYAALLAAAVRLLYLLTQRRRDLGLGASSVFLALFVHSLFYAGFFEDPIVWGVIGVTAWSIAALRALRHEGPLPEVLEHPGDGRPKRAAAEVHHAR
jgi:O-antigen ligase